MPVLSGGATVSTTTWSAPYEHSGPGLHPLASWLGRSMAYDEIYRRQIYVNSAVNKLVGLHNQLPKKVYRRAKLGREDARDTPFGQLIARPSPILNQHQFWGWYKLQHHNHGISFARKVRDRGGRPVWLELIHPTRMRFGPAGGGLVLPADGSTGGRDRWWLTPAGGGPEVEVLRRDLVIWARLDSTNPMVGMSPMEPLRETLENDHGARRANAAMWRNGGKHSVVLKHPGRFNNPKVTEALRQQYADKYGGVDNWGKPLVLQENMDAVVLTASENLEYIDTRKLNREEVATEFDLPPNAIGINDRSTFSNVTEQNRQLYRSNMPPHLDGFEATIEFDLRDGRFGEDREPDFGADLYYEALVDGVMRGSYEERIDAHAKGIQTGQVTPAEVREMENRPFEEGSDTLLINAAVVPITEASRATAANVETPLPDDGTTIDDGTTNLLGAGDRDRWPVIDKVMGRLARAETLADVDPARVVDGLDDGDRALVLVAMHQIQEDEGTVPELRNLIKYLMGDRR